MYSEWSEKLWKAYKDVTEYDILRNICEEKYPIPRTVYELISFEISQSGRCTRKFKQPARCAVATMTSASFLCLFLIKRRLMRSVESSIFSVSCLVDFRCGG